MSKGHNPRPFAVSREEYRRNFDATFGKRKRWTDGESQVIEYGIDGGTAYIRSGDKEVTMPATPETKFFVTMPKGDDDDAQVLVSK